MFLRHPFHSRISADSGLLHWLAECLDEACAISVGSSTCLLVLAMEYDNFLADYSPRLLKGSDRAGTFHPLPSFRSDFLDCVMKVINRWYSPPDFSEWIVSTALTL